MGILFRKMLEGMRGLSISRALITGLRMYRRGEEAGVRGSRERGGEGGEGEIRIRSLSPLPLLNRYGGMSKPSNDRWLFIALNPSRLEHLEAN
jgi:hypothetical protein